MTLHLKKTPYFVSKRSKRSVKHCNVFWHLYLCLLDRLLSFVGCSSTSLPCSCFEWPSRSLPQYDLRKKNFPLFSPYKISPPSLSLKCCVMEPVKSRQPLSTSRKLNSPCIMKGLIRVVYIIPIENQSELESPPHFHIFVSNARKGSKSFHVLFSEHFFPILLNSN